MTNFEKLCQVLESEIESSYDGDLTTEQSEKLALKFLHVQMQSVRELKKADLDSRMRKSGLKALRAAVYLEEATKGEKKPSDVMLQALVDVNKLVQEEQNAFDSSESDKNELEKYYDIFVNAHICYRGIAKGNFNNG